MSRVNCWGEYGLIAMLALTLSGCGTEPAPKAPREDSHKTTSTATPPSTVNPPKVEMAVSAEMASVEQTPAKSDETPAETDSKPAPSPADAATPAKEATPLNRQQRMMKVVQSLQSGMQKVARKQEEAAYPLFLDAGRDADQFLQEFTELSEQERLICAHAFYNQACALAMKPDAPAALAALTKSIASGYNDFESLDGDSDLEEVRKLSEYASLREDWEKSAAAAQKAEVTKELAEFESYPFDFTLPDLDDMSVKLADFVGKVVIVDIWGTWCPPCRAEIPSFVKLQSKFGEQGFQMIGLNYERTDDPEAAVKGIRKFIEANNMNYPCLIGDEKTQAQVPEFRGFPTTLFIDRTGKVRLQFVGLHPYGKLEAVVLALLAEEAK